MIERHHRDIGEPEICVSGKQVSHPKVLLVTNSSPRSSFALVGSGNLSKGGFVTNVECWLYIRGVAVVQTDPASTVVFHGGG